MLRSDDTHPDARLPGTLLAYAVALALLLLVPPRLGWSVGPPAWFTMQEAVDLFTPIVVIPLAWWAFDLAGGRTRPLKLVFLLVAIVWVEGQAIHLAANAIGDAVPVGVARETFYATDPGDLDHWLDEELSHWLWHGAWAGISILLVLAATIAGRNSRWERASGLAALAGVIHGATFFVVTVEGQTTSLGIAVSLVLLAWCLVLALVQRSRHPVVTFFLASSIVTLLGYLGWAALHDWQLPEFCGTLITC
jgi:hypothetical protein